MSDVYTVTGTLQDGHIVILDENLPVKTARLKITMETISSDLLLETSERDRNGPSYLEAITAVREALHSQGRRPLSKEEADAYIQGERDSWNDEP